MATLRLTKSIVENLTTREGDLIVWDEALPGFGVRVKPSGFRSYILQYRAAETGASRRLTIGRHGPLMTLDQARRRARGVLADAMRGADPVAEKAKARAAPNVTALCGDYLERHAIPNKRPKSVREDRSMIARHVQPALGARKVADVTRRQIEDLHRGLADRPYLANRVLALLSKMFNLAVAWGWRADNPVKGVPRFPEQRRERWLTEDELQRLWSALDAFPERPAAAAVRLQLLTGARIGEVLGAKKSDFDLERGVWIKPSHETKQKRTEHLPLSAEALSLIESAAARDRRDSPWLFPGRKPGEPLKDIKRFWSALLETAEIEDYRRHDNRHTYASHLVSSGLSLEIVGRLLGHTSPQTTKRYAHLADDALREATEAFGSKLSRRRS